GKDGFDTCHEFIEGGGRIGGFRTESSLDWWRTASDQSDHGGDTNFGRTRSGTRRQGIYGHDGFLSQEWPDHYGSERGVCKEIGGGPSGQGYLASRFRQGREGILCPCFGLGCGRRSGQRPQALETFCQVFAQAWAQGATCM
ncbi:uncharacterized protein METZ01_LOCUS499270, partial [marine metagenome]